MQFENGKEFSLWDGPVPLAAEGDRDHLPTITPYFPSAWKANHRAVIIFPGGGYYGLAEHEGKGYAEYFADRGYCCFVVKYRLGSEGYHHPAELSDGARAVRLVRSEAVNLGIRPDRIGVIGSSAGGHLAATVCNMHGEGLKSPAEEVTADVSSRPDFAILCYAVITSDSKYWNKGSFVNLLGGVDVSGEDCRELSQELNVTAQTPPTFLWHTMQDSGVPCENSLLYAQALRKAGVPFELHIYEKGPHGIGLCNGHPWAEECTRWMDTFK